MLGDDGKVFAFGDAAQAIFGDAVGQMPAGAKAVHIEPTPTAKGYWINDDRGGVYAFGDAAKLGGVSPVGPAGRREGHEPLGHPVGRRLLALHQQGPGLHLR